MTEKRSFFTLLFAFLCMSTSATELSLSELEARGAIIGSIEIRRNNVFDEPKEGEVRRLQQLANKLHYLTRENVIRSQLLFASGEPLSKASIDESTRILRNRRYLFDATVTPTRFANGVVDLVVTTRDLWTLSPEVDYSSTGGDTFYRLGVEDDNVLGTGASLTLSRAEELERTSNLLLYSNNNFLLKRLDFGLGIVESDDGGAFSTRIVKPFFSLDTKTSQGVTGQYFDGNRLYFRNGDDIGEYEQRSSTFNVFRGWSKGRQNGWIKRWSAGVAGERSEFSLPDDPLLAITRPENRELYYPYISFNAIEDDFVTTRNFQSIDRVEDVYLGTQYSVLIGLAHDSLGSDRTAFILTANATGSKGSPETALWQYGASLNTRLESGRPQNLLANANVRWSLRQSDKYRFLTSLSVAHSERPDLDRFTVLGGGVGLRGYPTRFRNGGGRILFTAEQRYYSNYFPFQLLHVGAAAFVDVGQVWGENVLGETNDDLLVDAGFGLRLVSPRGGSNKVIHIDLAFPLTSREGIDSVQLVLEAKRAF
ncbi:MAG: hypothetical protein AB8G18_17380 [Gammaproteobacteria bacterium]